MTMLYFLRQFRMCVCLCVYVHSNKLAINKTINLIDLNFRFKINTVLT